MDADREVHDERRAFPCVTAAFSMGLVGTKHDVAPSSRLKIFETHIEIATDDTPLTINIKSDSQNLIEAIRSNWRTASSDVSAAEYYCLRGNAAKYGFPDSTNRKLVRVADGQTFLAQRIASYAQVKVHVRGIASAVCGDNMMFVHGCTLELTTENQKTGVLILGASGAGKTTLVARLKRDASRNVRIVNDDWGPVNLSTGVATYTGEKMLHMKRDSVIQFSPETDVARMKKSDQLDHDRILIRREDVFGDDIAPSTRLRQVVVIRRNITGIQANTFDGIDLASLEEGDYSPFYNKKEKFLNGALLLDTADELARHRENYTRLIGSSTCATINNCGSLQQLLDSFDAAMRRKHCE